MSAKAHVCVQERGVCTKRVKEKVLQKAWCVKEAGSSSPVQKQKAVACAAWSC